MNSYQVLYSHYIHLEEKDKYSKLKVFPADFGGWYIGTTYKNNSELAEFGSKDTSRFPTYAEANFALSTLEKLDLEMKGQHVETIISNWEEHCLTILGYKPYYLLHI